MTFRLADPADHGHTIALEVDQVMAHATTYRARCPICGEGLRRVVPGGNAELGAVIAGETLDLWCPGCCVITPATVIVAAADASVPPTEPANEAPPPDPEPPAPVVDEQDQGADQAQPPAEAASQASPEMDAPPPDPEPTSPAPDTPVAEPPAAPAPEAAP